jgi:hypothetical protein
MVPYQAESVGCFASKFHHPQHAWPGHFDGQAAGTSLRCGEKEMVWLHLRGGGVSCGRQGRTSTRAVEAFDVYS